MKKHFLGLVVASTLLLANSDSKVDYELQLLNSVIPNTKISRYEPSEIQGFYKVYLDNGNLFYVNPFNKLLVFGEIWTNKGFSITQNDKSQWQEELSKTVLEDINKDFKVEDLTKVGKKITYGKGSNKYDFLIFTDPECPYCKIAEEYFEKQNVDLYVVFKPFSFHKNARNWSLISLSSKDIKSTMQEIREGNIPDIKITENAKKELQNMEELANKLKVNGTPKIIVIDKKANKVIDTIDGANIEAIEKYQKENN
ncbi:DsbC family protein [Aliarcobacter butzleri]|uniref:DsbC family protein n=1 Tax=Aliarcobacter butzleri TaxID=28197 RepID=UPI000DB6355F|nr:DsbC family protein [Aliarcobacter butzleri]MCT7592422.1 DsbC family protein [Aliarcobacter butzleri]PZQ04978.1 MAG: thiol [Aliarcobacter butzleri]